MLGLGGLFQRRWQAWLLAHSKPLPHKTLNRSNIYIVPTKAGFGLLFTVVLLLFTAVNYQNNSLFLLAFIIVSVFILSILATFDNLNGVHLSRAAPELVRFGETVRYGIKLAQTKPRFSYHLDLSCDPKLGLELESVLELDMQPQSLALSMPSYKRGRNRGPRIKLESRYPFGLVRAWSWADLMLEAMVYPAPVQADLQYSDRVDDSDKHQKFIDADDWHNIRSWREGESPKQILWSAYARSNQLLALDKHQLASDPIYLDWHMVEGDVETRLSILCFYVLKAQLHQTPFALVLPGVELAPASGAEAVERALIALALFGEAENHASV